MFLVLTWTGLDAGRPERELGVGVVDHLVGFAIVEFQRRTNIFTGSIIAKISASLETKWRK